MKKMAKKKTDNVSVLYSKRAYNCCTLDEITWFLGRSHSGRRLTLLPLLLLHFFFETAIMLGMMKMTFVEIRAAILAVDDAKVDENTLVQFSNYVPTPDEVKLLEPFKQEVDKLAAADHFFLVVRPVSRSLPDVLSQPDLGCFFLRRVLVSRCLRCPGWSSGCGA